MPPKAGQGHHGAPDELRQIEKFNPQGWRNSCWAVFFWIHVCLILGWIAHAAASGQITSAANALAATNSDNSNQATAAAAQGLPPPPPPSPDVMIFLVGAGLCGALLYACLWMGLLQSYPTEMVNGSLYLEFALLAVMGVMQLAGGDILGGLFMLIGAGSVLAMIYCMAERIKFTGQCFKAVSTVYSTQKSIFGVAVLVILLQTAWQVASTFAILPVYGWIAQAQALAAANPCVQQPGNMYCTNSGNGVGWQADFASMQACEQYCAQASGCTGGFWYNNACYLYGVNGAIDGYCNQGPLPLADGVSATFACNQANPAAQYSPQILLFTFSSYWGAQVFSNLLHVTCAGVIARWYFNKQTDNAVSKSFTHAFTNYFGAICLGSFLIAVIQLIIKMVDAAGARQQEGHHHESLVKKILFMVLACILRCLERLAEIFNTFAFVVVAIYGVDYVKAGSEAYRLLTSSGAHILSAFSCADIVCFIGALVGGAMVGGTVALLAVVLGQPGPIVTLIFFTNFITTLAIMIVVSRIVESGCDTLFVCFAEEPEKLGSSSPEIYNAFKDRVGGRGRSQHKGASEMELTSVNHAAPLKSGAGP